MLCPACGSLMWVLEQVDNRHHWVECNRCKAVAFLTISYYTGEIVRAEFFREMPKGIGK